MFTFRALRAQGRSHFDHDPRTFPSIEEGHNVCCSMIAMTLSAKSQAAARHLPVARARESGPALTAVITESRTLSESRLQVGVGRQSVPDDGDPYADVPCTD